MRHQLLVTLRWVGFLPVTFLTAWLAYIALYWVSRLTMNFAVDPDSWLGKIYLLTAPNMLMGAAFVYVGAKIAPAWQVRTALALAALGFALLGFAALPAVMSRNWSALLADGSAAIGVGGAALAAYKGETTLRDELLPDKST